MKIAIIFEDTGMTEKGEGSFNCYVEGLTRDLNSIPEDELTAAEYWVTQCFPMIGRILEDSGCVERIIKLGPFDNKEKH